MDAGSAVPDWRPMRPADLAAVSRIAAVVHPGYPERDAVFAERLRLCPEGCFVLAAGDATLGYAISHPWRGDPPPLDTLLGELPAEPDAWYVHDLAILLEGRGRKAGAAFVREISAAARRHRQGRLSLVAVGGTGLFWQKQGFRQRPEQPTGVLQSYGGGTLHMEKMLTQG